MHLRRLCHACGRDFRSSVDSARAAVAFDFYCSNSVGYTPCSRHQALSCAWSRRSSRDHCLQSGRCSDFSPHRAT